MTRRRGRRPAGEDTKAALLAAAREIFTDQGYDSATVRAIAARAGVDPAMVNHWFGSKQGLFAEAVLQLPFRVQDVVGRIIDGPPEQLAERMVRTFVTVWDANDGGQLVALIRSVTTQQSAANALRDLFVRELFSRATAELRSDNADLRATLCASQIVGLGMIRYVLRFQPLASADVNTVVAVIAPNLQHYLTGKLQL